MFPWKLISSPRESSSEHPRWGLRVEYIAGFLGLGKLVAHQCPLQAWRARDLAEHLVLENEMKGWKTGRRGGEGFRTWARGEEGRREGVWHCCALKVPELRAKGKKISAKSRTEWV